MTRHSLFLVFIISIFFSVSGGVASPRGTTTRNSSSSRSSEFPVPPEPTFTVNTSSSESLRRLSRFLDEQRKRYFMEASSFICLCHSNSRVSPEWRRFVFSRFEALANSYQWKKLSRANRDILSRFQRDDACRYIQDQLNSISSLLASPSFCGTLNCNVEFLPPLPVPAKSAHLSPDVVFSSEPGKKGNMTKQGWIMLNYSLPRDRDEYRRQHPEDPGLRSYTPFTWKDDSDDF